MALCISDLQEDKSVQKHSGGKRTYAKKLNKGKTWDNRRSGIENHHDNKNSLRQKTAPKFT